MTYFKNRYMDDGLIYVSDKVSSLYSDSKPNEK